MENHLHSWLALGYLVAEWVIRLVMLFVVPWRRPPSTATAWLLLVYFWPVPGLIFYLVLGRSRLSRTQQERIAELRGRLLPTLGHLEQHPLVARPNLPPEMGPVAQLSRRIAALPEFGGNRIRLIDDSRQWIQQLADDIDHAEDSVHLLFYIARRDEHTRPVFEAMERAGRRGVTLRLIVDDHGSADAVADLRRWTAAHGVAFATAMPRGGLWRHSSRFDLRNHRKIAVIDGRIGHTGSQNLIAPDFHAGMIYEDLMVRLQGPVVLELQLVFAGDWFVERNEFLSGEGLFPAPHGAGDIVAQGLPSGPEFPEPVQQNLMLSLLHTATRTVYLVTPYFVPDEPTLIALRSAAQRGVDVRVVVSERLDSRPVQWAQESYYEELLEAGVTITRYPSGFLHVKAAVIDGQVVQIGSANFDIRSFKLNAEFSLLFYSSELALQLTLGFRRYEGMGARLDYQRWRQRSWMRKLRENAARLASPIL
ncbi:MAG: cardiolipin synthase [Halothiobacillaceae bacterium]